MSAPHVLENTFVRVAGGLKCREQFGNLIRAPGFHRDIDGGLSQIHPVVGAIVRGLHDVRAVVGENSGQAVQSARIVGKVDSQAHQASVFHQAALDDARQQGDVDVAAADQHRNFGPAMEIDFRLNDGEGGGSGAFGQGLFALQQQEDGVGDLFVVDGDDFVDVFLDQGQSAVAGSGGPRCRRRWWRTEPGSRVCRPPRAALHGGKLLRLNADDADLGLVSLMAQAMPPIRPPPPMGTTTASMSGMLLQHFQAESALAGDDRVIIERVDEGEMLLLAAPDGLFTGVVIVGAVQDDFGAV